MRILLTGVAGFIGSALASKLLARGDLVHGIDNINDYYDPALKLARLELIKDSPNFEFSKIELVDKAAVAELVKSYKPERVVHLAAQAGVRYSLINPDSYVESNLVGFMNILEAARHSEVEYLVYASSSSVYGAGQALPFSESDPAVHPISLYGATKRANEMLAHSYSHLFDIPMTGLRFFTVYGPWGRPDMSPILFTQKILAKEPIQVFSHGKHQRDFTYIDDVVEATLRIIDKVTETDPNWDASRPDPANSPAKYKLYNIGNQHSVKLMDYIKLLEQEIGNKAIIEFVDAQPGDVSNTLSDSCRLAEDFDFQPKVSIEQGIKHFIEWYKKYYKVNGK